MRLPLILALLYAALALGANPSAAEPVTPELAAQIEALRTGDLRKLILHDAPLPVTGTAYQDAAGVPLDLSAGNGKFRVLNFWATWCAPCREEMPALSALQQRLGGDRFEVMAIATGRNRMSAIEKFYADFGVTLPILLDPDSSMAASFGVMGLPVTVLLNAEGAEIGRLSGGADWAPENAVALLSLLAGITAPAPAPPSGADN